MLFWTRDATSMTMFSKHRCFHQTSTTFSIDVFKTMVSSHRCFCIDVCIDVFLSIFGSVSVPLRSIRISLQLGFHIHFSASWFLTSKVSAPFFIKTEQKNSISFSLLCMLCMLLLLVQEKNKL